MAPVVALPILRSHPRWSPRWGLRGACSLWARSCGPSRTLSPLPPHPAALSSGGGSAFRYRHPPCRPCRLPFVARMSQARRKHRARLQWGGGFPLWGPHTPGVGYFTSVPCGPMSSRLPPVRRGFGPCLLAFFLWLVGLLCSLFFFFCVSTARRPSLPPACRSVLCPPPPMSPRHLLAVLAPFLGGWGRRGWGGGAPSLSVLWRKHVASTVQARGAALVPLQVGGGGGASRVAPVVALPILRSHPQWSPRWGLHGACFLRTRSCGPSRTLSPLPPHLAALSSGGGGAVRPSLPSSPTLGGAEVCVCGGGGGLSSSLRCTHVAGTTQARRRHEARHLSRCRGGGACLVAPVVALSTMRSHPRWSPC